MKLYGIWCKDLNDNKGDWLREFPSNVQDGGIAILAFTSKREAQRRAADNYGYDTYSEAKKNDWVEVRPLSDQSVRRSRDLHIKLRNIIRKVER